MLRLTKKFFKFIAHFTIGLAIILVVIVGAFAIWDEYYIINNPDGKWVKIGPQGEYIIAGTRWEVHKKVDHFDDTVRALAIYKHRGFDRLSIDARKREYRFFLSGPESSYGFVIRKRGKEDHFIEQDPPINVRIDKGELHNIKAYSSSDYAGIWFILPPAAAIEMNKGQVMHVRVFNDSPDYHIDLKGIDIALPYMKALDQH